MPVSAGTSSAPRSWLVFLKHKVRRRRSCATCATRSPPTGCARPGTPPPTGRVGPARARRVGLAAADQGEAGGRCRPAAARGLARGDAGVLRRARLPYREDSSNPDTKRGLIRDEILPLLEQLDPRARASLLSLADERPRLPRTLERTLAELLANREGTKAADLGGGVRAVREYGTLRLEGAVQWGPWTIESERPGLEVRARRPGDRLAGRRKKVQDLLVDAKVPRAERDGWPLVVAATRSSPCPAWRKRRGGKER